VISFIAAGNASSMPRSHAIKTVPRSGDPVRHALLPH
jgi:hypothetical protein